MTIGCDYLLIYKYAHRASVLKIVQPTLSSRTLLTGVF